MCMEIGEKLREARVAAGQTQEKVAETIGVSRQTISNWENNRSYPDIISVLSLSDLYHVSLDTLLKEDQGMIAHLEESTNVVKSRRDMSRLILLATYLVIWAFSILYPAKVPPKMQDGQEALFRWKGLPPVFIFSAPLQSLSSAD